MRDNPRREFIRHTADVPLEVRNVEERALHSKRGVNFSHGGLAFASDVRIEPGSLVELRIPVVIPPFEAEATVVWCRPEGRHFLVGVEFLDQSDAFRSRMVQQVCAIEQYRESIRLNEGRELTSREAAAEWIDRFAGRFPVAGPGDDMEDGLRFNAVIRAADGGGAYVEVPLDIEAEFGRKRAPVNATFDGIPYRGSVVRMGGPEYILIVLKEIRDRIGKQVGDTVEVTLELDTGPRTVEVPKDLKTAIDAETRAAEAFAKLSYTHQREYVQWIEEAKRAETRARRIARAVTMLIEGKKAR